MCVWILRKKGQTRIGCCSREIQAVEPTQIITFILSILGRVGSSFQRCIPLPPKIRTQDHPPPAPYSSRLYYYYSYRPKYRPTISRYQQNKMLWRKKVDKHTVRELLSGTGRSSRSSGHHNWSSSSSSRKRSRRGRRRRRRSRFRFHLSLLSPTSITTLSQITKESFGVALRETMEIATSFVCAWYGILVRCEPERDDDGSRTWGKKRRQTTRSRSRAARDRPQNLAGRHKIPTFCWPAPGRRLPANVAPVPACYSLC